MEYMASITEAEMAAVNHGIVVALALGKAQDEVAASKLINKMMEDETFAGLTEEPVGVSEPTAEIRISPEQYAAVSAERDVYNGPLVKTTPSKIIVNRYSDFGCA